jgi:aryl-alcohol dehydrogenase-like predicted oxidoreductase
MTLPGRANSEGTARFRARHADSCDEHFFRPVRDLWLSSIGLGTYLGRWDREHDDAYRSAIETAAALACNVIDTAVNYRFQRSERAVGAAIGELCSSEVAQRDELVVCTKGGYLPFDGEPPADVRTYIEETFVRPGIATIQDFVGGSHCMTPAYLQNQIDCSLRNLDLECVDVYYLHNPESQLSAISKEEFSSRLRAAFALFEQNIADGKIANYGVATWNGFRADRSTRGNHSLEMMVKLAREVGGDRHGFRFIQLPYNWSMREALIAGSQTIDREEVSALEAAFDLGLTVMASASILQGQLSRALPDGVSERLVPGGSNAQAAIQFTRSAPGITTALVGMSDVTHVEENLALRAFAPVELEDYGSIIAQGA